MKFLVLHGPNLNLLGTREPEIYGKQTLEELNSEIQDLAQSLGHELRIEQHNIEGSLVESVQKAAHDCQGILINPGAYTHTSVALRDALIAIDLPTIEVHLSVPMAREDFRQINLIADVVTGRVEGFGPSSYLLALRALDSHAAGNNLKPG